MHRDRLGRRGVAVGRTKIALPMRAPRPSRISRRCLSWLVWLGLLLPVAQVGAAAHALSHTRADASRDSEGKQAPQASHCDLCLIAAAVGGAAPLGQAATLTLPAIGHELPQAAFADLVPAEPAHAYRSRAPPDASR
jgi:hypothetical protein